MNFGQYAVLEPFTYHFRKMPDWTWRFRAPTSGDELKMLQFMNRSQLQPERGLTAPSWLEMAHREISLTFAGTLIPMIEAEPVENGGKPLIAEGLSVEKIELILQAMPHEMIMEIWQAMGEHVPGWGYQIAPRTEIGDGDPKVVQGD